MTSYTKSAYGSNPNAGKSPNGAQGRGWGTGWPNCQSSKMVKVVSDAGHSVNVRREIAELVATLFEIQLIREYDPNPTSLLQTWGFACRAIANTRRASNHSWGLAIDNRATENPYSTTFHSTIPPKVVNDWEVCGFYWGGRYSTKYDTMHFEYIGTPAEVAGHLAKARAILKSLQPQPDVPVTPPNTGDWFDMATKQDLKDAIGEYMAGLYDASKNGTAGKNHQEIEALLRLLIKQEADRYQVYYNSFKAILTAVAADDANDVTQADVDTILAKMEELKPKDAPVPNP
jgi:hypothetical protein